jgi:hypothetical protein
LSPGRPRSLGLQLCAYAEPNVGSDRTPSFGEESCGSGKVLLDRELAGHSLGERGHHLVGGGPLPVYEPIGEPPAPFADRLERDRDDRGGNR